jgi:two-component system chemotaxis sensor kinase CheA
MENQLTFDITADELEIFLEDVNESLQAMEIGILHLEQKNDSETLHSIFRAAHTLKALAGTVGHRPMAELTHTVETIFGEMREGRLPPTQAISDELLAVVDVLTAMRDEIVTRRSKGVDIGDLLARLRQILEHQTQTPPAASPVVSAGLGPEEAEKLGEMAAAGLNLWHIHVVVSSAAFAPTARLYQVGIALMEAGQVVTQQPALEDLSERDDRLQLILATDREASEIEAILKQIDDLSEIRVEAYLPLPPEEGAEEHVAPHQHPSAESHPSPEGVSLDKTVRISVERLDRLMTLVGELVTSRTHLLRVEDTLRSQYGKEGGAGALSELASHFSHVIDQLQEEVMRARMLPIASLFNKFPRLVRDVARMAGKEVTLSIKGEATELDRAVIEAIGDPLIHLLRNAVDHGIESPEVRHMAGKPPVGLVELSAAAVEGQIVLIVKDDGHGLDPERIRRAAVKKGQLTEEEVAGLSNEEAIELIFRPNLSTAEQVTEMSGRGVGLDVVRTNIERLSGSVIVSSEMGQGTTFRLTLPLTLALVQTMLVIVRQTLYAIPVTSINAALYLAEANLNSIKGRPALTWQGAVLPLLDLREFFARAVATPDHRNGDKPSVVLVTWGKLRVGLVVDKIIGQQEIVVKSLSPLLGRTPGLSGATILGDGQIALIVDIPGLVNAAIHARREGEL